MRIKRIFCALAATVFAAALCGAGPVRVTADPMEFPAGDWTQVSITFDKEPERDGLSLPKIPGAVWHTERIGQSQSISIVNGRRSRSVSCTLPLSVSKPGALVIPPVEVRFADGTTARSNPLALKVLAPGEAPRRGSGVAARIVLPERRGAFYVGEEIPVVFELSVPETLQVFQCGYPEPVCDGPTVMMPVPRQRRDGHPHFSAPEESFGTAADGGSVRTLAFRTRIGFTRPGTFALSGTEVLVVGKKSRRTAFDDDFFGFGLGMTDSRRVTAHYPAVKLELAAVPPPPAGTLPLGIMPEKPGAVTLSAATARVGEPIELQLALGAGNALRTALPKLELPGFRVYPAELKSDAAGGRFLRYALVPLQPGEHGVAVAFSAFDPAAGKWQTSGGKFAVAVTGGPKAAPASVPGAPAPRTAPTPRAEAPAADPAVPPPPCPDMRLLPLAERGIIRGAAAFGILALVAFAVELCRRLRSRRDPERAARRAEVKLLIRRVESGGSVTDVLSSGGAAALARALGVPETTPPGELAGHVRSPELRTALEQLERDAFAPEPERQEHVLPSAARRELVKLLRRALVVIAAVMALDAAGGRPPEDLPRARLAWERMHRLAPRDRSARAALAELGKKLDGEEPERESLRELFRPDEYLACAGVLLGLALLAAALFRRKCRRTAFAAAWLCAAAGVLAAVLARSQYAENGPYRTDRAVVVAPKVELTALPVPGSRVVGTLDGGAFVTVVEETGGYLRVRGKGAAGFCPAAAAERVFPAAKR